MQYKLPFRNCILCFQRTYYLVLYNHDELTLLHPVRPASCTFRPLLDSCNTTNSAPHRFPFLAVICSPSNRSIEPSIARSHGKPFQSCDRAVQTAARHLRRVLELPALLEHRGHLDGPVAVVIVRVLGGHRAAPDEGHTRWQLVAIAAGNFEAAVPHLMREPIRDAISHAFRRHQPCNPTPSAMQSDAISHAIRRHHSRHEG
jgi:hypothetical protein